MKILPLVLVSLLAAVPGLAQSDQVNDPIEGLNRATHSFNDGLDRYILRPVSKGWTKITPQIVRDSFKNFDDNLRFPVLATNDILQWKWRAAGDQTARFAINSTVGILGLRDVATDWGFPKQNEDSGQTFGAWGIPPGPYLVLPLFGPSNPRDVAGLVTDSVLSLYWLFAPFYVTLPYRSVDVVNRRALADQDIESTRKAALDYYVFLRNAYAQRRDALIRDMETSEDTDSLYDVEDDLYDIEDDY